MRRWIVAAVVVALAVGAAVAYTYAAPKRYDAISRVVVHPVPAGDNTLAGIDVLRDSQDEEPIMATAAAYFTTPDVVSAAADALGTTPDALRGHLDVRPLTGSNVLQVVGKDEDGRRAAEIANAVRQAGIAQRTARFQAQLAAALDKVGNLDSAEAQRRLVDLHTLQGRPDPTLESLTVATAPEEAAWPDRNIVIPAGVGIGLGLAALIVLLPPLLRPGHGRVDEDREQELAARGQELATREEELADREQALQRRADAITQREVELAAAVEAARAATADEARVARRVAEVAKREQGMAREAVELKQRERALHDEEQALAGRASLVDDRALRSAARSAELDARAHELRDRIEALAHDERELQERAQSLAHREAEFDAREEAIVQRERELEEREAAPPPEPEPERHPPGGWTIQELDRAVAQHADAYPERLEEWRYYLHFLRGHADVDGRLPATFHDLVDETFAEALVDASPEP